MSILRLSRADHSGHNELAMVCVALFRCGLFMPPLIEQSILQDRSEIPCNPYRP